MLECKLIGMIQEKGLTHRVFVSLRKQIGF